MDEYPGCQPYHAWHAAQAIAASATLSSAVFDTLRGTGPSSTRVPATGNATLERGVSIGERLIVEVFEIAGVVSSALDIVLLGGLDETSLLTLATIGTVASGGYTRIDRQGMAFPFFRVDLVNTDAVNAANVEASVRIVPL